MRFIKTLFLALFYQSSIAGAVAVLYPIGSFSHVAIAAISAQIRFDIQFTAKIHKFICAEMV